MPNVIQLLNADQREVERLFAEFESTRDRSIARQICDELTAHAPAGADVPSPVLAQIDRVRSMSPDDPQFWSTVTQLKGAVLPAPVPSWSSPTPSAAPAPAPAPTEVRGFAPSTDFASMKKDELYSLAKERKLKGRSSMTKDELIRALSR